MDKCQKLQEQLAKKSGKVIAVIPWGHTIDDVLMDIQVGEHSSAEIDSFQVLTTIPTDEQGWINIENRVLRMIKASEEDWTLENEE